MSDNGLMIIAKLSKIEYAKEANGWDNLVFECHQHDDRLDKSVPVAITALLPTNQKNLLNDFSPYVSGSQIIVPVSMRRSKTGSSFLVVTGSPIDATMLLSSD